MGLSVLEVSLPTLSEKTRSIKMFSEELSPVSRGRLVCWDEVCHGFVYTHLFSCYV